MQVAGSRCAGSRCAGSVTCHSLLATCHLLQTDEVIVEKAGSQVANELVKDGVGAVDLDSEVEVGGGGAGGAEGKTAVYVEGLLVEVKNGRCL